jgi:Uri superfamily endonuclease
VNASAPLAEPGTYALVLRSRRSAYARVGRLGRLRLRPGYYIYVGSAFGPGGVRARVSRHCRASKPKRWHIDYLREFATPLAVLCSYEPVHLEHRWADALGQMADLRSISGFGCSDCRCAAHLFFSASLPDLDTHAGVFGGVVDRVPLSGRIP